jgi:kinetochore protein Nuf2
MPASNSPICKANKQQTDREIADCITDIGMPFTVEDLRKPQPHDIQRLFEYFASVLLNLTRDVVTPAMRAAADEMSGVDADRLFSPDTRDLMGLFVMLRRLLNECSITDFSLNDLYKPTYQRLQKILSYIINFIRFRESHTSVIDKHFEQAERTKLHVQQLYADKENLEAKLALLQRERASTEKQNREKENELAELKPRLLDLDRKKSRLVTESSRAEDEKKRLLMLLDERSTTLDSIRSDAAKLRPYTLQRPDAIESNLRDLNATLTAEKAHLESLERRVRALATSAESFASVSAEVSSSTRLLSDLGGDLAREEEELAQASRCREALSEKTNSVQEVERTERLMKKQLEAVVGRTEKLRGQAEERNGEAGRKMEELKSAHSKLSRERGEKSREIEKTRINIEKTEQKVCFLYQLI